MANAYCERVIGAKVVGVVFILESHHVGAATATLKQATAQ